MITASNEIQTLLRESSAIGASTRVLAEWNMNRYFGVSSIGNGSYVDDPLFPIASIVEPRRPARGILKARIAASTQAVIEGRAETAYTNEVEDSRYYVCSLEDPYKYYASSDVATNRVSAFVYEFTTVQRPFVVYESSFPCNKIVIGVESSESTPAEFVIETTTNGTTWNVIAENPFVDSSGQIILYLDDTEQWTEVPNYENITEIRGLRMSVSAMDMSHGRLNVIEMSPRLETNVSRYVIDWDADFTMADISPLLPIGRSSSNTGTITLSNIDLIFNNDREFIDDAETVKAPYYNIIDKNVRFKVDFGVKKANGSFEYIRQLTMYAQEWSPDSSQKVQVDLKDSSSFAQDEMVPSTYFESQTVGAIIWRLMDIMGYTNYYYEPHEDDSFIVPFFWTSGDESLWEVISKLGETTQTAIYFDEYDILQIQTKNRAYEEGSVDWPLRASKTAGIAANIVDLQQNNEYEANSVTVRYSDTGYSDDANGFPKMEVSWEPEQTVVLRSSPIRSNIVSASTIIRIPQVKAVTWPYAGLVNIEAEIIRYDAKEYHYYDVDGLVRAQWVTSLDDQKICDSKAIDLAWKNYYTGDLRISKRGEFDTPVKDHLVITNGIGSFGSARYVATAVPQIGWGSTSRDTLATWNNNDGYMRLATDSRYADGNYHYLARVYKNNETVGLPARYGTRFKFAESGWPSDSQGIAGMHFLGGLNGDGIYITVHTTALAERAGWHNEVCFAVKNRSGSMSFYKSEYGEYGIKQSVVPGKWYDLDATAYFDGSRIRVNVYLNGVSCGTYSVAPSEILPTGSLNSFGPFVRTHCIVDFEYVYAFGAEDLDSVNSDEQTRFLDLIQGDYRSAIAVRDYQHMGNIPVRHFFDEFTPVAHEVREYNVKFDENPVLHSYLYFSNDSQVVCTEYRGDPFGARFVIANASRTDAIVSGEDNVTFGPDNSVEQKMFVYGRLIEQQEAQNVPTVESKAGIRRRGKIDLTIESKWVQKEEFAQSIADWIITNWGEGCEELSVSAFYNPLIQLGDIVSVSHPLFDMSSATHLYFVVGVKRSFANDGPELSLTLRRARV